ESIFFPKTHKGYCGAFLGPDFHRSPGACSESPFPDSVRIESSKMKPSWGMEIRYKLKASDGSPVQGTIHNTLYEFGERKAIRAPGAEED
ncbi:MAG: hypothetical protein ACKN9S_04615, partial [Pirellula sp.]